MGRNSETKSRFVKDILETGCMIPKKEVFKEVTFKRFSKRTSLY